MNVHNSPNVRRRLAQATDAAHQALHHHPLLCRLLAADLRRAEYDACLRANLHLVVQIEAMRGAFWPAFHLRDETAALTADLGLADPTQHFTCAQSTALAAEALGALYVVHGSRFGGQIIGKAVAQALPDAPCRFFGVPTQPALWRALLEALQQQGPADLPRMMQGADAAFGIMRAAADRELHRLEQVPGPST